MPRFKTDLENWQNFHAFQKMSTPTLTLSWSILSNRSGSLGLCANAALGQHVEMPRPIASVNVPKIWAAGLAGCGNGQTMDIKARETGRRPGAAGGSAGGRQGLGKDGGECGLDWTGCGEGGVVGEPKPEGQVGGNRGGVSSLCISYGYLPGTGSAFLSGVGSA